MLCLYFYSQSNFLDMKIELSKQEIELLKASLHQNKRKKLQRINNETKRGISNFTKLHETKINELQTLYSKLEKCII